MRTFPFGIMLLALGACRQWDFKATQPPREPFKAFGQVQVRSFRVLNPEERNEVSRQREQQIATRIRVELEGWLRDTRLFENSGKTLVIEGKIIGYGEGSPGEYYTGVGEKSGRLMAEVVILNESGTTIAKGVASADSPGWSDLSDAGARLLAKGIMEFIRDNYQTVR
jgi:hypothetical protein